MAKIINLDQSQPETKPKGAKIITIDPNAPTGYENKNKQSMSGKGPDKSETQQFNESVGHIIPSSLAAAGSIAGGPVGGAAGSFFGQGLREASPELFGKDSGDVGSDLAFNTLLPGLMGGLNKFAAGPKQYIADKLSSTFGRQIPAVKNLMKASDSLTPGFESQNLDSELRGFSAPEVNQDQIKQIIQKASDASKDISNPVLRYAKNSLILKLGTLAGFGSLSPASAVTAGTGASLILGNEAIKTLTKDPEIAQMIIQGIKTPGSAEHAGLISQTLLNALRGTTVTLLNEDGDKQQATIDKDGKLVYSRK